MITIAQALEDIVKTTPFIEDGLSRNILNLTAVARDIRPKIEEITKKETSDAAIVMALKRRSTKTSIQQRVADNALNELLLLRNVTVRSNLIEYAIKTDPRLGIIFSDLLQATTQDRDLFVCFSQGQSESTLIISQSLSENLEKKA